MRYLLDDQSTFRLFGTWDQMSLMSLDSSLLIPPNYLPQGIISDGARMCIFLTIVCTDDVEMEHSSLCNQIALPWAIYR